ncbi:MAG: hypothetical protein N2323_00670 [candidate division WOR-3 bacterium]|nr:hypothetical protein [candidate division WOR-3 bacterium]
MVKILDYEYGERFFDNGRYLLSIKGEEFKIYNTENWQEEFIVPFLEYNLTDIEFYQKIDIFYMVG